MKQPWGILLLATALGAAPQPAAAQGVKVALLPAALSVTPGSEFELSIEVTRAGSPFNAFDMNIGYDSAALTLVPQTPISLQEGAYFVSGCATRFHRFVAGTDADTIADGLLCAGVSLTGPGQIYKLRFRASTTVQVTTVRFQPGLQFYNAGLFANPDSSSDATIGIGVALGVDANPLERPALRIWASPNPARSVVSFRIETDRDGSQRLFVTDIQGRVVRRLQAGRFSQGLRTVTWDGTNDSGLTVRPGNYVAMLTTSRRTIRATFMLLK